MTQFSTKAAVPVPDTGPLVLVADWADLESGDRVVLQHDLKGFSRGTVDGVSFDRRIFWLIPDGVQTRRMIHFDEEYKVRKDRR